MEMNIKILNYNKLKINKESDTSIESEMLTFFKNQSKFEAFLINEDFLQNIFNLISVNIFRIPKYKILDSNLEVVTYISRDLLEELVLQEDSSLIKIRDTYYLIKFLEIGKMFLIFMIF
jgi:hypothetical protein